ncbi:regulatory protein SoxS [Citreicella sp. SE45]|nr:regulatory protein SoxS [Citreicella sp. SE45]
MRTSALLAAAALVSLIAGQAIAEVRVVMVSQPGCAYCARWEAEIAPAYPNTTEGRFAPLLRADLRQGAPEGITYERKVLFTPTFILVDNGSELARLEGYPGEDFFWPLLSRMLEHSTNFDPDAAVDMPPSSPEGG